MVKKVLFDSINDEVNYSRDFDYFILDSYYIDQNYIDRYCEEPIKFIKIDDFNDLNLEQVEVVVNFCLRGTSIKYRSKKQYLGVTYFPVSEEFKLLRLRNMNQFKDRVDKVLVFFGDRP